MTHTIHSATHPHPNPGRIAGFAAAIALNLALLLTLLMPMTLPPSASPTVVIPVPRLIDLTPVKPLPPIPPVPPTKRVPAVETVTPPRIVATSPPTPVLSERGTEPAIDTPPTAVAIATPTIQATTAPVPGVRLEYLQAPPPDYPRAALRMRSQGTVLLQVLVDIDGRPLQVEVQDSSGDRRLDAAAREQVLRHWRFRPAMQDGRAVQAIGLVPVAFNLDR